MSNEIECKPESNKKNLSSEITTSQLFRAWLYIGFTSFGGGAVTSYLIQETFIYKHKWITEEDYARILAMCQIVPGINILATTILIGKQLRGGMGIAVSLTGLVLPSAIITVGMAAIYASLSNFSRVQAALRAVFAAIFGISIATNWRNVKPILESNLRRGSFSLLTMLSIMIGSGISYVFFQPPVSVLYLVGGLCGALTYWYAAKNIRRD
ncbi:chromate transporter [Pelosinus sp. sgz500959]|uniref:chromate transporter n=1 Tax=Pelosinus sp. sgz500959 TaxID=3242472 RepID=UPI00366ADD7D